MRLLNTHTIKLEEAFSSDVPNYAILSHTWGPTAEEVTFQDLQASKGHTKKGYAKIEGCCAEAIRAGYSYVWIDTCWLVELTSLKNNIV
jgi:hypothetical protein